MGGLARDTCGTERSFDPGGATQDLLTLNIDLASVMQAGRWKSAAMPMRYGEHVRSANGGMTPSAQVIEESLASELYGE